MELRSLVLQCPAPLFIFFFIFVSNSALVLSAVFDRPQYPCKPPHHSHYPFCNTSLPVSSRARSLVSHLTLTQKITQLSNTAGPVSLLGVPAFEWWSESLHGLSANGPGVRFNGSVPAATSFPQVLLSAAALNKSLWYAVAKAVAVEARAMYNVGQAGLTYWAPNINVFRDPRWGRGQETPGEDPTLTAAYAVEYVRGFQGLGGGGKSGDLVLSACCKHYTAYDLEKWGGFNRYTFNAVVTKQDMADTYQPPFRSCIEDGHASCLMCSYNQVDGVPACARKDLLDKARKEWGFNGYVTSDCDAISIIYENQTYAASPEDAVADVLKAGMDINCGTYLVRHTKSAVKKGKLNEEDIDRALFNLFSVQMRLGFYDGNPLKLKYGKLGPSDVCTKKHRELALDGARQGIVLLKNDNNFLPLDKDKVDSLAIVGPAANDPDKLGGGYTGIPCNPVTIFDGHRSYVQKLFYAGGCLTVSCESEHGFKKAISVAEKAEYVVVVAGIDLTQEREEQDRVSLLLPGKQKELIDAVLSVTKKPLVLVLMGGGPLDVSFVKNDLRVASILWVGYPGEVGGQAVADVIFGNYNPGGRLPVTWYPESFTIIPMDDMHMRPDPARNYPGRTYRFYTGDVIYRFGHGLSYSKFSYQLLTAPKRISLLSTLPGTSSDEQSYEYLSDGLPGYVAIDDLPSCDALAFPLQISVTNHGPMDGSHVVMVFSQLGKNFTGAPLRQLVGFTRVHTQAYKTAEAAIMVDPCKHLAVAHDDGVMLLHLGAHKLTVGSVDHELYVEV